MSEQQPEKATQGAQRENYASNSDTIKKWEEVQTKTFTNWANMHLAKRGLKMDTVLEGFQDGTNLINLLEIISDGDTIKKYVKKPKLRIQKIENLALALKFIEEHDVKLAYIGPTEIVDGNRVQTLGMIWTLILRFVIPDLGEDGLSLKQGLLLWCQRKTEPYDNVNVENFHDSFADGLAFNALIHRHRPELIDYDSLTADDPLANLKNAFDVAEKHLGIPQLLDAEDIVSMPRPDERSIMTYVAQLYKVFASQDNAEVAGKRIAQYSKQAEDIFKLETDYEKRARALNKSVQAKGASFVEADLGTDYTSTKAQIANLRKYKKTEKREWVAEQNSLAALFGNIQLKLGSMQRPPYVPPQGLSVNDTAANFDELLAAEGKRRQALNTKLRTILDGLRKAFAEVANEFDRALKKQAKDLSETGEASEETLEKFKASYAVLQSLDEKLPAIKAAEDACNAANIEENEFSDHEYDDLLFTYDQLKRSYVNRLSFLESTLAAVASQGQVSAEQLQEFKSTFDHFDTDQSGALGRLEFKSLMSSLGVVNIDFEGSDKKFDLIWEELSSGDPLVVIYDKFVEYMTRLYGSAADSKDLEESFSIISDGKDFITEADMRTAQIPEDQIQYLKSAMPAKGDGYDYKAWLNSLAAPADEDAQVMTIQPVQEEGEATIQPVQEEGEATIQPVQEEGEATIQPVQEEGEATIQPVQEEGEATIQPVQEEGEATIQPVQEECEAPAE